jgi:hypothetical protein
MSMITLMASPVLLGEQAAVMPKADGGFFVIPHVLPIDVSPEVLGMTVAEWLGVDDSPS